MEFVEDTAEGRHGLREDVRRLEAAHEVPPPLVLSGHAASLTPY